MKRFWYLRRGRGRVEAELDEELQHHLDLRTQELVAGGLSPADARREAVRQFGDLRSAREYCRQQDIEKDDAVQRRLVIEDLVQDLRIGLRGLIRAPLMTLIIIGTVGLGIGATTAIFAVVESVVLRPLPFRDPGRLVTVRHTAPAGAF